MFDTLTESLSKIFRNVQGRGLLKEADVDRTISEIRIALLEADVALPVVRDIESMVRKRALRQDVLDSVTPGQQIVKIVNDCILELLGTKESGIALEPRPTTILMVGVQGSGKTTSCAKLAAWLQRQHKRTVMLAGLDTTRAAAGEQLRQLAESIKAPCILPGEGELPRDVAARARDACRAEFCDTLILDSAGRTQVDDALMDELRDIVAISRPQEILLVADAMIGQDAILTAQGFKEGIPLSGLIFTRIDGDARGGAVLSARHVIDTPVKFLGTGEKVQDFEVFHPERIVSRIVGQGDVISLVERVQEQQTSAEADSARRVAEGEFDLSDMLQQLGQIRKMGGITDILRFLPSRFKKSLPSSSKKFDESTLRRQEAIILSMTVRERSNPKIIHANRRKRIASGSGVHVRDVNRLLKQFQSMRTMMKLARKQGRGNPAMVMPDDVKGVAGVGPDALGSRLPFSR